MYSLLMIVFLYIGSAQGTSNVPLIPRATLFGNPEIAQVTISPDGLYIAYLAPLQDTMNIWIQDLDGAHKRCITQEKRSISSYYSYFWGHDKQSIFYFHDADGNENWNIHQVNLATGEVHNLTPFPDVQVRLIRYSPKNPHQLLVGMNKERADIFDLYIIDTMTGEITLAEKNPGYIAGFDQQKAWYADDSLTAKIAYRFDDAGGTVVLHRSNPKESWVPLLTWDVNASAASTFLAFDPSGDAVYLADSSESDKAQFVWMNCITNERRVLTDDPEYDILNTTLATIYNPHPNLLVHPVTGVPVALFVARDRFSTVILDESFRADFKRLEQTHLGFMWVRSTDSSFEKWIIACINDNRPVEYYLYNRTTKDLSLIALSNPQLAAYEFAHTEPIVFSARDGVQVHGYLTYPTTTSLRSDLPVVLLVHGGPWIRDCWGFNSIEQYLANRGYVCLQINYRASSGYGTTFVRIGNREYGRAMQNDLSDGVQWLIDKDIANPRKIAIFGGSYGGYAALAGAAFTPHLYACAIDLFGKANLIPTETSIPPYWKPGLVVWKYRVGDPVTEETMLRDRSPANHLDKIQIPMLVAHGAHDARIKQSESDRVVAALRERCIPCTYILFPQEGHGFAQASTRIKFYGAVEKFLAENLGGRYEK